MYHAQEQAGLGWVAAATMAAQAVYEYGVGTSKAQKARLDSCQEGADVLVDGIIHIRTQLKKMGATPYTPWWSEMVAAGGGAGPYSGGLMAALTKLNVLSEIEGGHAPFNLYADLIRPAEAAGNAGYWAWRKSAMAIPAGYIGTRQAAEAAEAAAAEMDPNIEGLGIFGRKRKKKAGVCERVAGILGESFEELMLDWEHAKKQAAQAPAGVLPALGPEIDVAGFGIPLWGLVAVGVLSWWSMRGARA